MYDVEQLGGTVYALGSFERLGHYTGPGRVQQLAAAGRRGRPRPGLVRRQQEHFLDASTGDRVELAGPLTGAWLHDVEATRTRSSVLGGRDIKRLAGTGYEEIGFLSAIAY